MKERFWALIIGIFLWSCLFFSGWFSWLTPLPLFYLARRYSWRVSAGVWALSTLLVCVFYQALFHFLAGSPSGAEWIRWFDWLPWMGFYTQFGKQAVLGAVLVYSVFLGGLGLLFAWRSASERDVAAFMGWTLGLSWIAAVIAGLLLLKGNVGVFYQGLVRCYADFLDQVISVNKSVGNYPELMALFEKKHEMIVAYLVRLTPGFLWTSGLFLGWLNLMVARRLFGPLGFFPKLQELFLFRAPFFLIWIVIGTLSLFLLNTYLWRLHGFDFALYNLFIVFLGIYFFQGLAIFSFYLILKGVSPLMRFVLYSLLLLFLQPMGFLLVGLGFFDSWFNFRKLKVTPT